MVNEYSLDTPFYIYKDSSNNYNKVCNKCGRLQYHSLVFCDECTGKFVLNKTMTWRNMIIANAKYNSACISIYHSFLHFIAFDVEWWNDKNEHQFSVLPEPLETYKKEADALFDSCRRNKK